jgi:hypothetical protein
MPHEPGVDKPGEVISGKALRERQAMSDIGHFQYYDNQTRAIAHTGRVLLDLIPHYYSEERMQRIVGEDGVPEVIQLNHKDSLGVIKNDVTVGRYDVVMDTGPGYETKRLEEAEQTVDLLKIPALAEVAVKAAPDLIFRNFGMDELADRTVTASPQGMQKALQQLPKEAQNIVKALQMQLQQAQQLIQHQALEIKYKGGIVQMQEQAETQRHQLTEQTKRMDIITESQTKVHDTHVKAQAGIAEAEIGAAGGLMEKHVGGRYDIEAAKHALKKGEQS